MFIGGFMDDILLKKLKCRAIFIHGLDMMYKTNIVIDEYLGMILERFYMECFSTHKRDFELICCFTRKKGEVRLLEKPEWVEIVYKYLCYLRGNNSEMIKEIYKDISDEENERLERFIELFCTFFESKRYRRELIIKN